MPQVDPEPLSRTALKAQRLKPAPGQEPVKQVWSHKRREHIELFDPGVWGAVEPKTNVRLS
ncbi:hypothetical protein SSTU70S_05512 [Stutzerimonas stutzeri]